VSEAVQWCAGVISHRDATRLRQLTAQDRNNTPKDAQEFLAYSLAYSGSAEVRLGVDCGAVEAGFVGEDHRLDPVAKVELHKDPLHM
jgi:hypothetical protein